MRKRNVVVYLLALFLLAFLAACGSSNSIKITSSGGNSVDAGTTTTLTASGAQTINFAITNTSCPGNLGGSLGNATATSVVFTPPDPSNITQDCTVTVTATSATNPSTSRTITLTIKAITVSGTSSAGNTTTFPSGAAPISLTGTLNHENTAATGDVVVWSISGADITPNVRRGGVHANILPPACGSLDASQTNSGQSLHYTPPTITTACSATITAESNINHNKTTWNFTIVAPASQLVVTAPASATAGTQIGFTVKAEDASGNVVTGYTGTVHFSSTDGSAVLPANATLTNGQGSFNATLKTAGSQTITATDTVNSSLTGASGNIAVSPAAASHFSVSAPASSTAGAAFNFTVTALDPYNNTATGYTGTVHFTSTDGSAVLPANSTLTSGQGTFSATLKTAGSQTITATDTVTNSITGTSGNIAVDPAAVAKLAVSAPGGISPGVQFTVTVTAQDSFNNTATGYTGTVHFTSSDGSATLPADSTLINGTKAFNATLQTLGSQTITATDTVTSSITGTATISVATNPATHFSVSAPASATAGAAFNFTVQALDASDNPTSGYSGTVHFTTTDSSGFATLPANSTLTNGAGTFSATLVTAGTWTITATDTVTSSITGTSGNIAVGAGAATHLSITAPATATAGSAFSFTATALDTYNNTATGYAGTVHFTTTDGSATLPADSALTNGTGSFNATLQTNGTQTITGTDTVTNSITGTSGSITVNSTSASFTLSPDQKNYAVANQPYFVSMGVQGGTEPYTEIGTTSGTLPPGTTLSLTHLALEGTPTTAGTYTFTVQVRDNANHIANADVTVTVATAPSHQNDSHLNGRYSCLVRGFVDNNGSPYPFALVDSVSLTGGSSYSGAVFNTVFGGGSNAGVMLTESTPGLGTASGTINIGSDNHGIVTFTIPGAGPGGSNATYTSAVVLNSSNPATEFHSVQIDDIQPSPSGQHAEASCYRDTTTAFTSSNVNGHNFAFAIEGVDGGELQNSNIVGVLDLSGGNVTGEIDQFKADGSSKNQNPAGTYTLPGDFGTTGRFKITVNPGDTQNATDIFIYMIDSSRALSLTGANPINTSSSGFLAGNVRRQAQSSYSNSNLNAAFTGYWRSTQYSSGSIEKYSSTLLQGKGNGQSSNNMTVNHLFQDSAPIGGSATLSDQAAGGQTFTVALASNGRAVFSPDGTSNVYLYFYDNNSAFIMDTGSGVGTGIIEAQSSTATPSGSYMEYSLPMQNPDAADEIGLFTLTAGSPGTFNGTTDRGGEDLFRWAQPLNEGGPAPTYSSADSNGLVVVDTGDSPVDCVTITTSKLGCISQDDQPTVHILTK